MRSPTPLSRLLLALLLSHASSAAAVPPLVIGDVPTADPGTMELYVGVDRVTNGGVEWAAPTTETVLGLTRWLEVTVEVPWLVVEGAHGVGDVVLGTKLQFLHEAEGRPGLAVSAEWKLANGDQAAGLGSGSMALNLLLRGQKSWGWFTLIGNAGYTFVGEPKVAAEAAPPHASTFLGAGVGAEVGAGITLLADLYRQGGEARGAPLRAAGDVGLQWRLSDHLAVNGAVGTSVRPDQAGGPQLRAYLGLKGEFALF